MIKILNPLEQFESHFLNTKIFSFNNIIFEFSYNNFYLTVLLISFFLISLLL